MEKQEPKILWVINSRGERIKLVQRSDGSEMRRQAELFEKEGKAVYEPGSLEYLKFFLAKKGEYGNELLRKAVEIEPGVYVNSDNVPTFNKIGFYRNARKSEDYSAIRITNVLELPLKEEQFIVKNIKCFTKFICNI